MKYENFDRVKTICAYIDDRKRLLSRLESCEEVVFRYSSGNHILTIELNKSVPSPDYGVNEIANKFREDTCRMVEGQIKDLQNELNPL